MTEIKTGTDVLRAATLVHVKKFIYGKLARDLKIAPDELFEFAHGRTVLSTELLHQLCKELFPSTVFLPDLDLLAPADRSPPKLLGIHPPRYEAKTLNLRPAIPGPQPVHP